ncbi:ADP/ATP carrier protein [Spraguea lophii 42_110]|uniref:ADP,ATP carrier protein n=1 Tax=Spraguea lophii (strain 42_110) TaxID=1358809 RepID=S7WBK9_SPRLO|nr:ADP/ATP carrier protein [Spraguea lophii 42_110]
MNKSSKDENVLDNKVHAKGQTEIKGYFKIQKGEFMKFFILSGMFSLITLVYITCGDLKDTFVISKQLPVSIQVLKLYYIPLISIILSFLLQYFVMKFGNAKVLGACLAIFSGYFIIAALLYGHWEAIEPSKQSIEDLAADGKLAYKRCLYILPMIYTVYSYMSTIVYIFTEMWSSIVLSVLFFSYIFECCTEDQNIRLFPLLNIFPAIIRIIYFILMFFLTGYQDKKSYQEQVWNGKLLFGFLGFCALGVLGLLFLNEKTRDKSIEATERKKKNKSTFAQALKVMNTSKLALFICLMNFIFCVLLNLTEATYKSGIGNTINRKMVIKEIYQMRRSSILQGTIGIVSLILLLTPLARWVYTKNWFSIAIITPTTCGIAAICVFSFVTINTGISKTTFKPISQLIRFIFRVSDETTIYNLLEVEEWLGILGIALFKCSRYTLMDISKEALGVKISPTYRYLFKSVYDGIVFRIGKAFGSLITQMLNFCGIIDVREASPLFFILTIIFVALWIYSIFYLNKNYEEAKSNNRYMNIDKF